MAIKLNSLKPESAKAWVMLVGGLGLVILIIYYVNKTFGGFAGLFNSIQEKLGLKDSAADVAKRQALDDAAKAAASAASPWNANLFDQSPGGSSLSDDEGDAIAKEFWDSVSWIFGNNYSDMMAALKSVHSKVDLSFVVERFQNKYGKDLYTWLMGTYGNGSSSVNGGPAYIMGTINDYANSLK